jgi:hypothetical protein
LPVEPQPPLNLSHVFADRPLAGGGASGPMRFAVHGLAVELRCDDPSLAGLADAARRQFQPFAVAEVPPGFAPITGTVEPFDGARVQRHLSTAAVRLPASAGPTADLFHDPADAERFWLVDDRWGIAELNLLRGRWRAWVLPRPGVDATTVAEAAVLWPVAQLMRGKGLHLLPAVSVARDGWAALILAPFGIEPELTGLLDSGYAVIGQRWTAVRAEDDRVALLHLPGWVQRQPAPRLRYLGVDPATDGAGRIDLTAGRPAASLNHAFCGVVLVAEPGRRPAAPLRDLPTAAAANVLRRAWPLVDLQPDRKSVQLSRLLPRRCRCAELQLSREPTDLLRLLDGVRPRQAVAVGREYPAMAAA